LKPLQFVTVPGLTLVTNLRYLIVEGVMTQVGCRKGAELQSPVPVSVADVLQFFIHFEVRDASRRRSSGQGGRWGYWRGGKVVWETFYPTDCLERELFRSASVVFSPLSVLRLPSGDHGILDLLVTTRRTLFTAFQLVFAVALLVFLYRQGNIEVGPILALFQGPHLKAMLAAGVLTLTSAALGGVRLCLYFRYVDQPIGVTSLIKLNYVGFLMAQLLPGLTASDLVRGYFLASQMPGRILEGLTTMLWDRIIGLAGLLILGFCPALALLVFHFGFLKSWPLLLLIGMVVVGVLVIATDPEKISRIIRTLEIWLPVPNRLKDKKSRARITLKTLVTGFRLNLFCLAFSVLIHAINVASLLVIARAIGDETPLIYQACLIPVVILGGVIPATPGNVGWNEYISQIAWSVFGASPVGAQVFATYRIIAIVIGLPAFYWVVRSPMIRMDKDPWDSVESSDSLAADEPVVLDPESGL